MTARTAQRNLSDREARLVAGLADDALDDRRRHRAEALLAELPDGAAALDRQRRVSRALGAGPYAVPIPIPVPVPVTARASAPRLRWARPALALACAVAAAIVVVLAANPAGSPGPPSVEAVVGLGARGPAAPAPAQDGALLRASHAGVRFSAWEQEFGWRAIGQRTDGLEARTTRSVVYEHQVHRISYTVVSGAPLEVPPDARRVTRDGVRVALYRDPRHGGHDVATFQRDGRTCVLAGHVESVDTLVKLAAWSGDGTVSF